MLKFVCPSVLQNKMSVVSSVLINDHIVGVIVLKLVSTSVIAIATFHCPLLVLVLNVVL